MNKVKRIARKRLEYQRPVKINMTPKEFRHFWRRPLDGQLTIAGSVGMEAFKKAQEILGVELIPFKPYEVRIVKKFKDRFPKSSL